ncbi:MAG TPA: M15 family metallopeptidase, partial [Actinomycetota bacterium]|nr:M15 family metallopeptidase [Actinomycetota bacterium]
LAILTGLAVFVAGWVVFVAAWSGPAGAGPDGRGGAVAGARAADLDAFRNELLVWAPGGFSEREVGRVRDSTRVAGISAVRTGTLPAAARGRSGYRVVPVETMAVDTNAYASAAGKPGRKLATLLPKGAVLSKTGAKLRKVKSGGKLKLTGSRTVAVSGVVDDALLGGYEVALERTLARRYGIQRAAYLLVRPRGSVDGLQTELRKLLKGRKVRFVTPGDRPYVRGGDGVLPLAQVKARFGEFALPSLYRGRPDPKWTKANLVTRKLPVLGRVRCHRLVVDDLGKAMADVAGQGLRGLVDVGAFRRQGGCWSPRLLRDARGGKLSRHAWGIAVSLKVTADERLIQIMARHGFAWGGGFARPDATHFEWVGRGS